MTNNNKLYFKEKRFGNTVNGNPRKALYVYKESENGNLYLDSVRTFDYESKDQVLKKVYGVESKNMKEIFSGTYEKDFKEAKLLEKKFGRTTNVNK